MVPIVFKMRGFSTTGKTLIVVFLAIIASSLAITGRSSIHKTPDSIYDYGMPHIPSPSQESGRVKPQRLSPFPGEKMQRIILEWNRSRSMNSSNTVSLKEQFLQTLPVGEYSFGEGCVLRKRSEQLLNPSNHDSRSMDSGRPYYNRQEWLFQLDMNCLEENQRNQFPLRILSREGHQLTRFLRSVNSNRELLVNAFLKERGLGPKGFYTIWEIKKITYANPYLSILHDAFPDLVENELMTGAPISRVIHRLLNRAKQFGENGQTGYVFELNNVIRKGVMIHFSEQCPVLVHRLEENMAGTGRYRLYGELECLRGNSLGQVDLIITEDYTEEAGPPSLIPGQKLAVGLRFGGIFLTDNEFHILWETIKDIRKL